MNLDATNVGSAAAGTIIALSVVLLLVLIPLLVLIIIGRWKMYKKAGKQGWEAIVPFYSDWVYVEISGLEWWWFFALIITSLNIFNGNGDGSYINLGTLIGLFGSFVCNYNISKKLHKDVGFAVLMTLFPYVLLPMIGFSSNYTWDNDVVVSKNGPFDDKKENNTTTEKKAETKKEDKDSKFCPHCGAKVEKGSKFCSKCGKEI